MINYCETELRLLVESFTSAVSLVCENEKRKEHKKIFLLRLYSYDYYFTLI